MKFYYKIIRAPMKEINFYFLRAVDSNGRLLINQRNTTAIDKNPFTFLVLSSLVDPRELRQVKFKSILNVHL